MLAFTTLFIRICFAVFALYWIVAAFSTKRTLKGQGGGQWRLYAFIAVLALFELESTGQMRGREVLWPHTLRIGIFADFVALGGLLITLWARVTLGGNWSSNVVIKENHELIQRGPYAYVRHPIYSGVLLMILAMAINNGRLGWFITFGFVCAGLYFKALQEEKLLTGHFPDAYPNYRSKVKSLIPFVV